MTAVKPTKDIELKENEEFADDMYESIWLNVCKGYKLTCIFYFLNLKVAFYFVLMFTLEKILFMWLFNIKDFWLPVDFDNVRSMCLMFPINVLSHDSTIPAFELAVIVIIRFLELLHFWRCWAICLPLSVFVSNMLPYMKFVQIFGSAVQSNLDYPN